MLGISKIFVAPEPFLCVTQARAQAGAIGKMATRHHRGGGVCAMG